MRLKFLDRDDERKRIARMLSKKEGTFCCLYGRRRCGKSRLLQETVPAKNSVYYVGDERESTLQRAALAKALTEVIPGLDEVTYPDWDSLLERWWRDAPPGGVLIIDEFPYLAKSSPELPSLLQKLIDKNRSRTVHLILSGSSQQMMQGLVLDASAPLYGRAAEIINVRPLGAAWIQRAFGTIGNLLRTTLPFVKEWNNSSWIQWGSCMPNPVVCCWTISARQRRRPPCSL
jgi:AAA+ ATPase superfamily predicted ATPase